jgi:hypothetical protein
MESKFTENAERYLRIMIRFLYSWLSTDGEVLGYILGVCHFVIGTTIPICIILSHTLYPAFWFQCFSFIIVFIVWVQHIVFRVCISILAEKKFTKSEAPYFRIFRDTTGLDGEEMLGYLVAIETGAVLGLGLEIISKFSSWAYAYYDIHIT